MSKARYNFNRRFVAVFVVLLQLAVVPATHELHVACDHEACSSDSTCATKHACSCAYHAARQDEKEQSEEPHDCDSCPICQAAFAVALGFSEPPRLLELGSVSVLELPELLSPECSPRYRSLSRGPPMLNS